MSSKPDVKKLIIELTPARHRKFKKYAADQVTTMKKIVEELIDGLPNGNGHK